MIILSVIYHFLINFMICRNCTGILKLLCFGLLETKFVRFYWTESSEYVSDHITLKAEANILSDALINKNNDKKSIKRKNISKNCKASKRIKITHMIFVSITEKFPSKFKKLMTENEAENYTIQIEVKDFKYEDFHIFLSYYKTFYFPFGDFSISNFILFLNIFEYLEISIDENFNHIVDIFLWQICDLLENKRINLEAELSQQKKKLMVSNQMIKMIYERFHKNYISLKSKDLELLENTIKDLLVNEYDVELINEDSSLFSISDDIVAIFESILKNKNCRLNIFYIIFNIFDIKKVIFRRSINNLRKINSIINFFLTKTDNLIFHNMLINDEMIEFVNKNSIFNNLKDIHFINTKIRSKNEFSDELFSKLQNIFIIFDIDRAIKKNICKQKNIDAVIQVLKFKIKNNFKENISKLIHQGILAGEKYGYCTFTKNTTLNEVNNLILFRNEIVKIVILPNTSLSFEILSFLDILTNLKSIEINLTSKNKNVIIFNERYLFKNINKIYIEKCMLTKSMLTTILLLPDIHNLAIEYCKLPFLEKELSFPRNNTIKEFDLIHDFKDAFSSFLIFLKSFEKIENLSLIGKNIFKLLYFNEFTEYISNSQLKSFSIFCDFDVLIRSFFSLSCETLESLKIIGKFPSGTLSSFFSDSKIKGLQNLSICDCYISESDYHAFKNLNTLFDLEIENCNLENIEFYNLFSSETEYVIKELDLSCMEIYENDMKQICKFKSLKILNFNNCTFEHETFTSIKRFELPELKYFQILNSNLDISNLDTNNLAEEFDENILSITSEAEWD